MADGRTLAVNRQARHEYDILETMEAGLVLVGTEIKAAREGRANITEAFAKLDNGEMWLLNAHIGQYSSGGPNNHDPTRPRKLLLHKPQIEKWSSQVTSSGLTIVPLRLYLARHRAKVQLGLARGRRVHDKRRAIIDKMREREAQEAVRRRV